MSKTLWLLLLSLLLAACGAPAQATQEPPTPTPLPPDPALERPIYTVVRGDIRRVLEITGRVTPVDLERLAFKRDGRVNVVHVARGDTVKAGDVLAELLQDDALDELREAEDTLVQAERDLESARKAQAKEIRERELDVEKAQEALARLLPGGEHDMLREAQQKLEEAQRELQRTRDDASWTKTGAEEGLRGKAETLQKAQQSYSDAKWDWQWVQEHGTDPDNPFTTGPNGEKIPNKLTDKQKREFEQALRDAESALRAAERGVEEGQRELERAREDEVVKIREAEEKVAEAQREVDKLLGGTGTQEIQDARRALEQAQLALAEAREKTLNSNVKAVENARRALERAQKKVDDGRIIAPRDGQVTAIAIEEGAAATAYEPVVEVADPTNLEFAAQLSGEQMRQLTEGQPAEIRLLTRPDLVLPAVIRQLPAPYGSGGSGVVRDRDQTTRFQVLDTMGQTLTAGTTVGRISIVLEHKENVLWLPPEAVRAFEGRRFVVVREGERERRVPVRIGIENEEQVEILEGLEEGDMVVGQ
ncbi:MAG TPA: HlyD family efflux transporter periplasmic adaptor subunit [Roseiflexaceae bacterium]|nr:HlyD family efflux transporter periplasmic adaptor subunit [Roseiflexaceae bacterium]